MIICINGLTNDGNVYINTLTLEDKNGGKLVIDRDRTEWSYDKDTGDVKMEWLGCYSWDGEDEHDIKPSFFDEPMSCVGVDIEDDAPEGYCFDIREVLAIDTSSCSGYYPSMQIPVAICAE